MRPFPISAGQLRRAASTLFGAWWRPLAASRPPLLPPPMPRPAASSTAVVAAAVAAAIAGHHRCRCSYHLRTCAPACHLRTSAQWPLPTSMPLPMLAAEAPTLTLVRA